MELLMVCIHLLECHQVPDLEFIDLSLLVHFNIEIFLLLKQT